MSTRRLLASLSLCLAIGALALVPAAARAGARTVLWVTGDGADGGTDGRAVAELIASRHPDRFVYLGDVYPDGSASQFAANYRPIFGGFDAIAAPVIGNHEWAGRETGFIPYWSAVWGRRMPLYYSFAGAGWQLVALNSNAPTDPAQLNWLHKRMRPSRFGDCRIVLVHHPRFSAGARHGPDPGQAPLWSAVRGRARLVLSGHEHNSQRLRPVRGTTQLIAGAGGHELTPLRSGQPDLAFGDATRPTALKLALRPGRAVATFVAVGGQVLDRSVTRCRRGGR